MIMEVAETLVEVPGVEVKEPGVEVKEPGVEVKEPGVKVDLPGVEVEEPGFFNIWLHLLRFKGVFVFLCGGVAFGNNNGFVGL